MYNVYNIVYYYIYGTHSKSMAMKRPVSNKIS